MPTVVKLLHKRHTFSVTKRKLGHKHTTTVVAALMPEVVLLLFSKRRPSNLAITSPIFFLICSNSLLFRKCHGLDPSFFSSFRFSANISSVFSCTTLSCCLFI
uniref:Uncharacterized protein n=1 Tax=Triticum urartu TaxID=4572 RepID=A0A8R7PQA0_TRIUA